MSIALLVAVQAQAVTTVTTFTGGDLGEGLDFQGTIQYAINMRGPGGFNIDDANFQTSEAPIAGFSFAAANVVDNWATANLGASTNDNNLELVMRDIRWNAIGQAPNPGQVLLNLDNLTPGRDYQVQLLFTESCCNRGFDVIAEGKQIVEKFSPQQVQGGINGGPSNGALVTHVFTATDTTLNIVLDGNTAGFPDGNPTISGLTLEDLGTNKLAFTNVALGKPIIDSTGSYQFAPGFEPEKVVDGSITDVFQQTYWLGREGEAQQFFTLDLGQGFDVNEIRLRNTHNDPFNDRGTGQFRILASSEVDGLNQLINPVEILSGLLTNTDGQLILTTDVFNELNGLVGGNYRYIRFETLTSNDPSNNIGLNEIEVLGREAIPEPASAMLGLMSLAALALRSRRNRAA